MSENGNMGVFFLVFFVVCLLFPPLFGLALGIGAIIGLKFIIYAFLKSMS
jgi:hypothetical protein